MLPIGTFAETSGTYVSLEGRWQSFAGAAKPVGESRPGWKVLRVLGNLLDIPDFDYQSSEAVRDELQTLCKSAVVPSAAVAAPLSPVAFEAPGMGVMDLPMYQIDSLVRRAPALLATRDGQAAAVTY